MSFVIIITHDLYTTLYRGESNLTNEGLWCDIVHGTANPIVFSTTQLAQDWRRRYLIARNTSIVSLDEFNMIRIMET